MSALDDLTAAVAALADDVATEIAALSAAVAAGNDDVGVEAAVAKLKDLSVALKASVAPVVVVPPVDVPPVVVPPAA